MHFDKVFFHLPHWMQTEQFGDRGGRSRLFKLNTSVSTARGSRGAELGEKRTFRESMHVPREEQGKNNCGLFEKRDTRENKKAQFVRKGNGAHKLLASHWSRDASEQQMRSRSPGTNGSLESIAWWAKVWTGRRIASASDSRKAHRNTAETLGTAYSRCFKKKKRITHWRGNLRFSPSIWGSRKATRKSVSLAGVQQKKEDQKSQKKRLQKTGG